MSGMNWRDKDDLDLTSDDIDAMIAEGTPVAVRGPVATVQTIAEWVTVNYGPATTLRPEIERPVGRLVGAADTRVAL
jgi:hypothetical protein